jgi:hypothetical protein
VKLIMRPYWFTTTTLSMAPSALVLAILLNNWLKLTALNVGVQVWGMVMLVCVVSAVVMTASLLPSFLILSRAERALIKIPYLLKLAAIPATYALGHGLALALMRWYPDLGITTIQQIFKWTLCGAHALDLGAGVWVLTRLVSRR